MQGGHCYRRKCDALKVFAKLFPNQLKKTRIHKGLRKCNTKLRVYNVTNIPQLGALDTTITWKDKETKEVNKMNTTFYVVNKLTRWILLSISLIHQDQQS